MQASVNPVQPNPLIADVNVAAHGLSLPVGFTFMAVYVNSTTAAIEPADASTTSSQKVMFVTEIYGPDDIRLQYTGLLESPAHGLTVGNYYYITDAGDGGFSLTPGTVNDVAFFVVDDNVILLIDNRPV